MTTSASASGPQKKDWSANQYIKFLSQRTRPVYDLVSQIQPFINTPTPRIYDLGCGPGNSTKVLLDAFPSAHVTGVDSSADMLRKAREEVPGVTFETGDVGTYALDADGKGVDLVFSNAVFHWLRSDARIPALVRLFTQVNTGGVLAIQVPDNYTQHSHAMMRETAMQKDASWAKYFSAVRIGDLADPTRPDLDPIEPPSAFLNALGPLASHVDIWRTEYQHVLEDAQGIVEWVKGTGLQPYLNLIGDEGVKKEFLEEYRRKLEGKYGRLDDGRVVLGYPRLFVVAVRK